MQHEKKNPSFCTKDTWSIVCGGGSTQTRYATVDWKQIKPQQTVTFMIGATSAACGVCWQQWGFLGTVVWACFFFGHGVCRVSFGRTKMTVLNH
jgi:hypothetical protein